MSSPRPGGMSRRRFLTGVVPAAGLLTAGCTVRGMSEASARNFPRRNIRLIVPYSPGGSSDLVARALLPVAEEEFGQTVVTVNRAGSNGTIGTSEVSVETDGHTVLWVANGAFASQPFIKDLHYTIDDFTAVLGVTVEPILLAVNATSPWRSAEELVAAKAGDRVRYANSGTGGYPQLAQEAFFRGAGLDASSIPFDGGAGAVTALLGGQVETAAAHPATLLPYVEAGQLRLLGIFSRERSELVPDVPTVAEQGVDVDMEVWKFLLVPRSTPEQVVRKMRDAFGAAVERPAFADTLRNNAIELRTVPGDEVLPKLKAEKAATGKLIRELGLGAG